jgi:hypothetical protein
MRIWLSFVGAVVTICLSCALSGCGGGTGDAGARVLLAHLYQNGPGQPSNIRVAWRASSATNTSDIVAWLVYRDTYAGLPAEEASLIDARGGGRSLDFWDNPNGAVQVTYNRTFTYLQSGSQQTGTVDITYTHPALFVGSTYFYRARLVVKPNSSSPPISGTSASSFNVDPSNALTEASASQGPVTYFLVPTQSDPSNGNTAISPKHIVFNWLATTGADEYIIRVYTNASATGTPLIQSPVIRPISKYGTWTYDAGSSVVLHGLSSYYWTVGARASGQATPVSGTETGWLNSTVRQFSTVTLPPGS